MISLLARSVIIITLLTFLRDLQTRVVLFRRLADY